ncbi:MAG: hypothetical protein ABIJ86_03615 [Spirochaetota bacterium]
MKIKKLLVLVLLASLAVASYGQDLGDLETDLRTIFTGIAQEITPSLHQMAMAGNDLVGEAKLRGFTGFYFSLAGVNLTTMDGLGSVLSADSTDWKFDLISIPDIIKDSLGEGGDAETYFNTGTTQAMALPSLRIGFGFPLPLGLELLANAMYLPGALLDMGLGLAGDAVPEALQSGAKVDMFTLGGIIRKPILSDKRGFFRPSVSVGASYTYSSFSFGLPNFNLDDLLDEPVNISADLGNLKMNGEVIFATTTHSLGAVLHVSKTLFWVLTPYAKVGAYYHSSEYESVFEVTASAATVDEFEVETETIAPQDIDASTGIIKTSDVSIIVSSGLEIKLLPITLTTGVSLDLERPIVGIPSISDLTSGEFMGLNLNGLSIMLAIRIQI